MVHLILKLNIIQKVPVFRKERNKPFVVPFADLLSFVLQIGTIALIYLLIEKPDELAKLSIIEGMNYYFREGIYFVFTTITTVGYGDKSPDTTAGMAFVIIALYLYGAYRLLNLIDAFVSAKSEIRELKRNGRLFDTMKNHIIVYCDADSIKVDNFIWVKRFISEIKTSKKFSSNPVLFVNFNEEMAGRFNQFMAENFFEQDAVFHYNTNLDEDGFFDKICIEDAAHIFILANPSDVHSDSKALDFAIRIEEETAYNKDVTAEVVKDTNRKRMTDLAGVDVVIRPTRAYPSFLVSATIGNGVREVIEELMSRGKDTLEVFDVTNPEFTYGEFLYKASMAGIGTAVAITQEDGVVEANPDGREVVKNARKVILMINEMRSKCYDEIQVEINKIMKEL